MVIVAEDGSFLKTNPAFTQFIQISEKELMKKTFSEVTHPEDLQAEIERFDELISDKISSYTLEKRYKVNDHYVWGLLTAIRAEDGYIIKEIQDITKIKIIEENLCNFAYAASHDLREPLRIINGYAYMIQSAVQTLPPTFAYYVNNIVEAVNRMSEMIDGLLAYSRAGRSGDYAMVDLVEVIYLAQKNLERKVEDSGAILKIKGKARIRGIKGQLVQLFQNLLDNAIKYRHESKTPRINIDIHSSETTIVISVSDNGIGIDDKDYERVFQIFKQVHPKDKYEGRGVGLAIVKQIVEHHQGQIWLESKIGNGTTFCISIPKKNNTPLNYKRDCIIMGES